MKILAVVLGIAFAVPCLLIAPALSDPPPAPIGLYGTNAANGVDIFGETSDGGASGASGSPTAEGPGSVRQISCVGDPVGRLAALGDAAGARLAAAECASQTAYCSTLVSAAPLVPTLFETLGENGNWAQQPSGCAAGAIVVTAAMVAAEARRLLPHLVVGMAPEAGSVTLVNMQTIFWVSTDAVRSLGTVPIIGQQVAITVTFDHTVWDFGDGSGATAGSAGKAYDPAGDACTTPLCADYFGHVYLQRASVTASATTWWRASFSVNGGPVQSIPGTVDGPVSTVAVSVAEARSVLVTDPPGR